MRAICAAPCLTLAVTAIGLGACGDAPAEREPPAGSPPAAAHTVQVWFSRMEDPAAVTRDVRGAPLDAALAALVAGPTPAEREAGLDSWFSDATRHTLRRVRHQGGHVEVDFRDLPELIPGAGSSAGSQQLLTALDSTVFQFDWVESVGYSLDGSCDAFWEWLQRACRTVTRE